jgi:dolichyl-phosphate-mannose-protein mannosyltransferase
MASEATAVASGADLGDGLRQRPVVGVVAPMPILAPEPDDKKKQKAARNPVVQFLDDWEFLLGPILFTALAIFTRLWQIGKSNIVTWDEAQYVVGLVCLLQTPSR